MSGLAYLEWRATVHRCAAILRSPLRLALWIPYLLTLGFFVITRTFGPSHGSSANAIAPHLASAVAGLYVGTLGITIALAAAGRVYAFRNAAEPVLFSNAGIRPLEMALWLQLRKLVASGARWITGITYFFVVFAPRHAGVPANAREFGVALLAVGLQMSVDLPAFLLARGPLKIPILVFGWTVAALGFGFAAAAFFAPALAAEATAFTHFDPGFAFRAMLDGNAFAVIALIALLAALAICVACFGDDALPELYAASLQTLATRSRRNRRSDADLRYATAPIGSGGRIPAGALTLIWKDWASFRRGRGSLRLWLAACVTSAACGAGVAAVSQVWHDPSLMVSLGAAAAIALLVGAPSGASLSLANDLAKPLFWLSQAPLRARIAAWTFARTWRGGFAIGLAPLLAGIVSGNANFALCALPLAFSVFWSLQSLGVGLFALFPNALDSRGPMTFVRTLATGAYMIPPLVVAAVVVLMRGSPLGSALSAAIVFALEGWMAVELASLRFAERGASLGALSRAG